MKWTILPVAGLLAGCVLNADFDAYDTPLVADQMLALPWIKGAPGGDRFVAPTFDALMVDNDVIGGQVLQVNGTTTMRVAGHARPKRYEITWRGKELNSTSAMTRIEAVDSSGRVAVAVEIDGFELRFITGAGVISPLTYTLPTGYHEVTLGIAKGVAGNIDVSVTFPGGSAQTSGALDPVDWQFETLQDVRVVAGDGAQYAFDDMVVWLRN